MIICTFDDRASEIIGLQLLVASLSEFAPGIPIYLACPAADAGFEAWLADYPQVRFDKAEHLRGKGWDVKAVLLKQLLDEGHDQVMWMDSDIIVTKEFIKELPPAEYLVVTEESALRAWGVPQRVQGWGLEPGRNILGVNSCVIRAAPAHAPLVVRWLDLMSHPDYQRARTLPFEQRPAHLLGDQDVLIALLASAEFAHLKVHFLLAGREIIQSQGAEGYTPTQRLRNLLTGVPALVHSQGKKPWRTPGVRSLTDPGELFIQLHLETAPYSHYARRYREAIMPFPKCLELRTAAGHLSNLASFGHPALRGMSLSVAASLNKHWRNTRGFATRAVHRALRILGAGRGGVEPSA